MTTMRIHDIKFKQKERNLNIIRAVPGRPMLQDDFCLELNSLIFIYDNVYVHRLAIYIIQLIVKSVCRKAHNAILQ